MLSAADLDLVERDPAIPGLAVVLDPAAVLTLVAGHVDGAVIQRARPTYVRYKPRHELRRRLRAVHHRRSPCSRTPRPTRPRPPSSS